MMDEWVNWINGWMNDRRDFTVSRFVEDDYGWENEATGGRDTAWG
jgi:hypothetical protein